MVFTGHPFHFSSYEKQGYFGAGKIKNTRLPDLYHLLASIGFKISVDISSRSVCKKFSRKVVNLCSLHNELTDASKRTFSSPQAPAVSQPKKSTAKSPQTKIRPEHCERKQSQRCFDMTKTSCISLTTNSQNM